MEIVDFAIIQDINIKEKLKVSPFIHPTNSCYWFGWNIYNEENYNRIFEFKNRDESKPFFITVPDIWTIESIWIYDSRIEEFISTYPNTIFTFILERHPNLPSYINPGIPTVWVQIARWPLRDLYQYIDFPVFWTSANISWQTPLYSSKGIIDTFGAYDNIVFLDGWNLEKRSPSTIIDLTWQEHKIIRGQLV